MIFGVALLAACLFVGSYLGNLIGLWTGLGSDVGGVGFAMILLLLTTNSKFINKVFPKNYTKGIEFWNEMYIPVVIAMSASQNVVSALDGGILALVLGVGIVVLMLLLIPVFNMLSGKKNAQQTQEEVQK